MWLGCGDDLDPPGQEILDDGDQVPQAPAQAIQPPDEDASKATFVGIGEEPRQFRLAGRSSGDPGIRVLLADCPPASSGRSAELSELDLGILLGRGHASVESNWKA